MKTKNQFLNILILMPLLFVSFTGGKMLAFSPGAETRATFLYVKEIPVGAMNCADWANACDMQSALGLAAATDQVRVAAGTYKPTITGDRSISSALESGVAIYGGFPAKGQAWVLFRFLI